MFFCVFLVFFVFFWCFFVFFGVFGVFVVFGVFWCFLGVFLVFFGFLMLLLLLFNCFYVRSRLRDIGHPEPELPKKVAAPQHCRQVKIQFFILKYKFAIFKGNTELVR